MSDADNAANTAAQRSASCARRDVGRGHLRPLREVAPETPPELAAIVDHALQVERELGFALDGKGLWLADVKGKIFLYRFGE